MDHIANMAEIYKNIIKISSHKRGHTTNLHHVTGTKEWNFLLGITLFMWFQQQTFFVASKQCHYIVISNYHMNQICKFAGS